MEEGGGGSPIILTSLLALILAASGLYVLQEPLESSRPPIERIDWGGRASRVSAHLWQDPLRVAKAAVKSDPGRPPAKAEVPGTTATAGRVAQPKVGLDPKRHLVVLAVTLASDSSQLSREQRLRDRYAVWAALDTLGFEAADGDHLHIFETGKNPSQDIRNDCWLPGTNDQPLFVYELAKRNRLNASPFDVKKYDNPEPKRWLRKIQDAEQVLVLWTEDRLFDEGRYPLACLNTVVRSLEGPPSDFKVRVVGPSSSDTLRRVDEFVQTQDIRSTREPSFFSPMATTDTIFYAPTNASQDGGSNWNRQTESKHVERTIASDLDLARSLVAELRKHGIAMRSPAAGTAEGNGQSRGVESKDNGSADPEFDRILLLSEWDTYYGRAMPLSFAIALLTESENVCLDEAEGRSECLLTPIQVLKKFKTDPGKWDQLPEIEHVSYLRGLDGKVAEEERAPVADEEYLQSSATAEPPKESASGPAQLDYVRRLALEMADQEADERPIRAIGILGSDVYDKLLLIRALRDVFPDAVFFTTDLDARLWAPAEIRWTRNLIVASSFGLRLVEERDGAASASGHDYDNEVISIVERRQSQLPPFRDNYQASVYYATLRALGLPKMTDDGMPRKPIQHPRLFEIGQSGPELLDVYTAGIRICPQSKEVFSRLGCAATHVYHEFVEFSPDRGWFLRFGFLGILLVVVVVSTLRRSHLLPKEKMSYLETFSAWGGAVAIYVFILVVSSEGVSGEPFALFEGISIWPTEILRLVVFFLSLYLIGRTQRLLSNNIKRLGYEFGINVRDHPHTKKKGIMKMVTEVTSYRWVLVERSHETQPPSAHQEAKRAPGGFEPQDRSDRPPLEMIKLWTNYNRDGTPARRAVRVFLILIVYFLILRIFVFGNYQPIIPVRDPFGLQVDRICIALSVGAMTVLLLYIVDAVLLAERFIKLIATHHHTWPRETFEAWSLDSKADPKQKWALSEWLAIRFIALRTEVLGGVAVAPFFVLALFFISRASFFDRWHIPFPVWVAMGINFGMAIFAVVILWRSAEGARAISAEIISKLQVQAQTAGQTDLAEYIQSFADNVAQMRQGAFAPIWRQPFVQAVLAPIGGWAATMLFEGYL